MAEIEITPDSLVVHIRGADKFFALKSQLEVPLKHVAGAETDVEEASKIWHGFKLGGSNLPGVITAGRFLSHGEMAFWDVHDPQKAILIRLHDEGYGKVVVGVDDPYGTVSAINAALRPRGAG